MKIISPLRAAAPPMLAVLLLAAAAQAASAPLRPRVVAQRAMPGFAAVPLATDALRENDQAFLGKAVETSRQQMRLGEVGASQAGSSQVRTHALTLAADSREMADSLEALIRRKGGIAGAPVGKTSEEYQKLLEKSGDDFDRAFIRAADVLANNVLILFEQAASDARDTDVREFAAAQLPVLRAHHNTIEELKKAIP